MSERLARGYLVIQAVAIAAWWAALWAWPVLRAAFRAEGAPEITLLAFAPADLAVAPASALGAVSAPRGSRTALAWVVAGAMAYAAAYVLALAMTCAAGPLGAILMAPAALASVLAARAIHDADTRSVPDGRPR